VCNIPSISILEEVKIGLLRVEDKEGICGRIRTLSWEGIVDGILLEFSCSILKL